MDYDVIQDAEYGYLRIDPIPTKEEVERYYREEFYAQNYPSFNDSQLKVQEDERDFQNSRWETICQICEKHFGTVKGLKLFDVGCGYSQALLYFRDRGMSVCGNEPSPEGVAYAREKGLRVFQTGIEDLPAASSESDRYNIVTLINVLEHLRNPADVLMFIRSKMMSKGGLVVIDSPNEYNAFQMVANEEYNLNKWWLCPPNHINYFTVKSLCGLLDKCGYRIVQCESSFPMEMFLLMGDVYVGNGELGRECHRKRVKFEALMRKHGKEDHLRALYRSLADLELGRQVVVTATAV